jgi:hypothetical protein
MRCIVLALIAVACGVSTSAGQIAVGATPQYHGALDVRPAHGSFDPKSGTASVKVRGWRWQLYSTSNGIYPDKETVEVAIGEQAFMLPPGSLRVSRKGKMFSFRAPKTEGPSMQPIRSLRIQKKPDGYLVRFTVTGVDLSTLLLQDPVCMPTAILIGDDDGFSGVQYSRPTFSSHRLKVPSDCSVGDDDWPWA